MPKRLGCLLNLCVLCAVCCVLSTRPAAAQSSNGTYTLMQDFVSSGGGVIGGGNPMRAQTTLGLPAGGAASNATFSLVGGIGIGEVLPPAPITATVTVTGTIDDPSASVIVNGVAAIVEGNTFTAQNVQLLLGPNTITAVATDGVGNVASKSVTVYLDLPAEKKTPRFSYEVRGTIDDSTAEISVNGVPATIAAGEFSASVPLVSGLNTLDAVARDAAGNVTTDSIRVFVPLPTRFPAMPTVGTVGEPPPTVTTLSSLTIGGTKTPGTSIWINGTQVVALDDLTTWSAQVTLTEGDNILVIVAKDDLGTPSAPVTINIVVDNLPPSITAESTKTNFNPFTLVGSVDDSLTRVEVNSALAKRVGKTFEATIPLTEGPNSVTIAALSPKNHPASKTVTITLGTIPTIQAAQPADGAKLYAQRPAAIQITATDKEGDLIQFQVLLDGTPLGDWGPSMPQLWTPNVSQMGLHTLTVQARDDYGGSSTRAAEVFVVRPPIDHP